MIEETLTDEKPNRIETVEAQNKTLKKEVEYLTLRLQESEKSKIEFLSNVKNQLNNPLNSIIILSQHLMKRLADDKEEARIADLIYTEGVILDFVIKNLITAGEFGTGEAEVQPCKFNMRELIDDSLETFASKTEEKKLNIVVTCPDVLSIKTDKSKLSLALRNLISNAIEFNIYKGSIKISVTQSQNNVEFSIADDGSGFSKEEAELIFIPFKQLKSESSRVFKSSGIGLSLVKNIAEMLGGKIAFESKPGKGSIFKLSIPMEVDESSDYIFDF